MYTHICLYCGKEFESRRVVAAFCPGKSTCRAGYYRKQKREEAKRLAALEKDKAESTADAMLASLRQVRPEAAALVDELRRIAGAECVELAIRAGLEIHTGIAELEGLPMK